MKVNKSVRGRVNYRSLLVEKRINCCANIKLIKMWIEFLRIFNVFSFSHLFVIKFKMGKVDRILARNSLQKGIKVDQTVDRVYKNVSL